MAKQTIGAAAFKTKCLSLLDEVQQQHKEIVITKRGKPVARLVPVKKTDAPSPWGWMKGTGRICGDIVGPTDEVWNAERGILINEDELAAPGHSLLVVDDRRGRPGVLQGRVGRDSGG